MPSIRRLTQQGSAVVLASFLVASSSRVAASAPKARDVAKRWRERQPVRFEDLRRAILAHRGEAPWASPRGAALARRSTGVPRLAERFHAGGLTVPEPTPLNALLDPLGFFEDESGEEPPVGPTARLFFADFDGDGDLDVFVGDKYGYVRYLENVAGPGAEPEFVELTGADSPTGSLDLSFDASDGSDTLPFGPSAPTLVDIDGDDDLDLFVGQGYYTTEGTGGRILFFENDGGTFVRNDAENPFAGGVFGFLGATPTFVDIDEDGDFDAFVGTKLAGTSSPEDGELFFLRNEGDPQNPSFVDRTDEAGVDPFAGVEFPVSTAPYFADVDGDGDPDAFIGSFYATRFFRNETVLPGPPDFVEESGYTNPLAGSFAPFPGPVLADVDGDGDLDAFLGLGYGKDGYLGFAQYFENTGTPGDSSFLSTGDRLELVDVDGDGDLDALVSRFSYGFPGGGEPEPDFNLDVWYFRNLGSPLAPVWELQSGLDNPFFTFNTGYVASGYSYLFPSVAPTVGHLDDDGLLDAFVGLPGGNLEFLEDDGSGQLDPGATHPLESIDFGENADPELVDVNGDGELDLIVGYDVYDALSETYESKVAFFLNPPGPDGLEGPPDLVLDFTGELVRPAPTLADLDGDGDLDLLVGGYLYDELEGAVGSYGLAFFVENTGSPSAPAFDPAGAAPVEALIFGAPNPAVGDVDGDGFLDLFLGNMAGVEMFTTTAPGAELPEPNVLEIPTLSQWGSALLAGLLSLLGLFGIRRFSG